MTSEPDPAEFERRLKVRIAELAAAHRRIEELTQPLKELRETQRKVKAIRRERDALKSSVEYRLGRKLIQPFRKLFGKRGAKGPPKAAIQAEPVPRRTPYHWWKLARAPSPERLLEMREESGGLPSQPLISVVMPVYNTPGLVLEEAVESMRAQVYGRWELIAVDDGSSETHVRPLLERLRAEEPRIVLRFMETNGGISVASNAALAVAQGEFVAFLDHDDWLEPDALFEVARRINEYPDADFIYSDEDKVDETGYFQQPFFKPDWSPDAFLSINYCCHFTAIRRALVDEAGGFRTGFDGAQDYDLFLRATERARRIVHIPRVLYHWRISAQSSAQHPAQKPAAIGNAARALREAIERRGLDAVAEPGLAQACHRVRYRIKSAARISILIPAGDRVEALARCLESLARNTGWPVYETVVLDHERPDSAVGQFLRKSGQRTVKYDGAFSLAAIRNFGARESDGEWLLFLDPDTEFSERGWLDAMAEHVQRPEVGAVGGLMVTGSGVERPGGILLAGRDALEPRFNLPRDLLEDGGLLQMIRNYSAVTAACMLVRRRVFEELGGFDEENFYGGEEEVDLCLRLRARDYWIVYTPYARVGRQASDSGGSGDGKVEGAGLLRERWGGVLAQDPFNNPNLVCRAD
jgi:glycosyltransferase involved in cell wall biosynthesis